MARALFTRHSEVGLAIVQFCLSVNSTLNESHHNDTKPQQLGTGDVEGVENSRRKPGGVVAAAHF